MAKKDSAAKIITLIGLSDIGSSGVMELVDYMRLSDMIFRYNLALVRIYTEKDYTEKEVEKLQNLLDKLGGM